MRSFITTLLLLALTGGSAQVLTAEEAVRIAVEQNYGIRLARIDARSAQLLNNIGNAGLLPTVDAVGLYTVDNRSTKQTFFSGEVREADDAEARLLDAAIQLNWTVFDGLAMFAVKDQLEALEAMGQARSRQRIESTTYEVLSNYYLIVQLRKAIDVQREGLRISRERLRIAEAAKGIGSASGLMVVQARLDLSTDSATVLDLQMDEAVASARLNALMGRSPSTAFAPVDEIPVTNPQDLGQLQQAARQTNSTLQTARLQQIATDQNVKQLRGALLPRVDIFGNYGYTRSSSAVGFLQSNQSIGPDYGARLNIPLFRGFQANRALQVAKLSSEQAAISTRQAELDLEESLLNTWTSFTLAIQRVALEEDNLTGARTLTDVALESYRLGAINAVELRDVQLGLVLAEQRLIAARYEARMAELQLLWLAGRLM